MPGRASEAWEHGLLAGRKDLRQPVLLRDLRLPVKGWHHSGFEATGHEDGLPQARRVMGTEGIELTPATEGRTGAGRGGGHLMPTRQPRNSMGPGHRTLADCTGTESSPTEIWQGLPKSGMGHTDAVPG